MTRRPFDIITFDCHGTLIDWVHALAGRDPEFHDLNGLADWMLWS